MLIDCELLLLLLQLQPSLANWLHVRTRHETRLSFTFRCFALLCAVVCVVSLESGAFPFVSKYLGPIKLASTKVVTLKSKDKGEEEMGF